MLYFVFKKPGTPSATMQAIPEYPCTKLGTVNVSLIVEQDRCLTGFDPYCTLFRQENCTMGIVTEARFSQR